MEQFVNVDEIYTFQLDQAVKVTFRVKIFINYFLRLRVFLLITLNIKYNLCNCIRYNKL